MVTYQVVYRFFGIPVWSVTKVVDEEALYNKLSKRFEEDMIKAIDTARGARG